VQLKFAKPRLTASKLQNEVRSRRSLFFAEDVGREGVLDDLCDFVPMKVHFD